MTPIDVYGIPGFREPFSSFSHMLAIPFFLVAGWRLVRRAQGNRAAQISLGIMVASTVFLLMASTLYHIFDMGRARYVFWQLDMAGIFIVIAGTVTPLHVILFRGINRWLPIVLIWLAAIVGITVRNLYAMELMKASDALFVLMGWGGAYSVIILWRRYGFAFIRPMIIAGVIYTLGVFVITWNWPVLWPGVIGPHEFWHLFVLAGLYFHWKFMFQFAAGPPEEIGDDMTPSWAPKAAEVEASEPSTAEPNTAGIRP